MPQYAQVGDAFAPLAYVDPASQNVGSISTPWVSANPYSQIVAHIQTGVLGAAATVDAKLQRAVDAVGTGAADIPNKAITQIVKATGDNKQALIIADAQQHVNGFVRLVVTVGGAASQLSATLLGIQPSQNPQALPASVAQIVR